jgi:hypothetical protein
MKSIVNHSSPEPSGTLAEPSRTGAPMLVESWPASLRGGFGVFLCTLAMPMVFALHRRFPYLLDGDEYAILGGAAFLAGLDWQTAPMPYYGFLGSLLTAPLYLVDIDPVVRYRLTLSGNAVMLALSATMTFHILRSINRDKSSGFIFLAVVAAFVSPAAIFLSSLALGESVLLFMVTSILYLSARLFAGPGTRPMITESVLLGICCAAVCYAHSRGIVMFFSAVLVLALAVLCRQVRLAQLGAAAVSCLVTYLALLRIKSHLLAEFYSELTVPIHSIFDFLIARSGYFSDAGSLVETLRVAFGQIFYLSSSTYGVWLVCIALLLGGQWHFWREHLSRRDVRGSDEEPVRQLLVTYILVSIIGIFCASVVLLAVPERADHYFYGRYNEVLLPAAIAFAFTGITRFGVAMRIRLIALAILGVVLMAAVVSRYPARVFDLQVYYPQVTGWFIHRHGSWKIDPQTISTSIVAVQCLLALLLLKNVRWFLLGFILVNACSALYLFNNIHRKVDENWREFAGLESMLNGRLDGATIVVHGGKIKHPPALQFTLPRSRVLFDSSDVSTAEYCLDYSGEVCVAESVLIRLEDAAICRAPNVAASGSSSRPR